MCVTPINNITDGECGYWVFFYPFIGSCYAADIIKFCPCILRGSGACITQTTEGVPALLSCLDEPFAHGAWQFRLLICFCSSTVIRTQENT